MPAKKEINLLKKKEFDKSPLGITLHWALTYGRYIIIGTEIVVLLAFISRFKLDRDLTDLREEIAQKQAIIASYGDLEQRIRQLQAQLKVVSELDAQVLDTGKFIDDIASFTPLDVVYSTVHIQPQAIAFSGTAFSEAGFRTMLTRLRQKPEVQRISVKNMSSGSTSGSGIEFSLTVQLAGKSKSSTLKKQAYGN